jgi:hypothetical protein
VSTWIRKTHRWLATVFTLAVVANFLALGREPVAYVVGAATLLPLSLLLLSGIYLLAQPYAIKWRRRT